MESISRVVYTAIAIPHLEICQGLLSLCYISQWYILDMRIRLGHGHYSIRPPT
jgi:hypothetical protein